MATNVHHHPPASPASPASPGTKDWGSAPPWSRPVVVTAPHVSGATTVGSTLTSTVGTWYYVPSSYAYQWLRDGANIAGATGSTYVLVAADVGSNHLLSCKVTAVNAEGSASSTSNALTIP